jgi:hypothetical protein
MTLTKRLDEILSAPKEQLERIFFKCSYHYLELQRLKMLDRFSENVKRVRDAGCSFVVEFTPNDESIPFLNEIKDYSLDQFGALPNVTVARDELRRDQAGLPILTKLPNDQYLNIWRDFNSSLFDFKCAIWGKKINEFCYAGKWSYFLNFYTGITRRCYVGDTLQNLYKNPSAPIIDSPVGTLCNQPHCYNGHAFLGFGFVPSMKTPTYAELRDRVCQDGTHWLTPRMRALFSQKLYDNNPRCTLGETNSTCHEKIDYPCQTEQVSFLKLLSYKIRAPFSKRIRHKLKHLNSHKDC